MNSSKFYIIMNGVITISGNNFQREITTGMYFGESALVRNGDRRRTASA